MKIFDNDCTLCQSDRKVRENRGDKMWLAAKEVKPLPPLTRAMAAAVWPAASIVRMMYHMALRRGRTEERGTEGE